MKRLSKGWAVSHKNGYYVAHKVNAPKTGKNKGIEQFPITKTFPSILSAWEFFKEAGEDTNKALALMELERKEYLASWAVTRPKKEGSS